MSLENDKKESVKLDQILKYLFTTSNKVLVNLLNGLFDESFKEDEVDITVTNNEYIEESLDVLRGDMFYTALEKSGKKVSYHIEFQTKNDSTMVIRTFEYGFRKARDEANNDDGIKTICFPKQKVIFFEENNSIEDALKLKIVFPDQSEHIYEAGVMKYWNYTTDDIVEKKMYPLIPLQLFTLRKELKRLESKKDQEGIKEISKQAKELARKLAEKSSELFSKEEFYGEDFHKLLLGIQNLIEYLNRVYFKDDSIEEDVVTMTKTLYDPEVEKKGIEQGIEKGKLELVKTMIANGADIDMIVKFTGFSKEEVGKLKEEIVNS